MPIRPRALRRLAGRQDGVAATEFAMIAPVFLMLIVGVLDLGQMAYGVAVLNGAVQRAARDSSLETATTLAADNLVKAQVQGIFPGATFSSTRTRYNDFVDVARPEKMTDVNGNGFCDPGEPYVDENNNLGWDADIGVSGNGGANDVIVYRFTVVYQPLFKVPFMPDKWNDRELTATAIRKNQPYGVQQAYGAAARVCS